MNTLIDILLVSPFVALLAPGARRFFWISVVLAIFVAEFFSPFRFGMMSVALGSGWALTRKLITFFDMTSLMSVIVAFFAGIFVEVLFVSFIFLFEQRSAYDALLSRGSVFAARQFLACLFIFTLIMGLRAAYTVGIYAMAEEKNPFA